MLRTNGAEWCTERRAGPVRLDSVVLRYPKWQCSEKWQHFLCFSVPQLHHLLRLLSCSTDTSNLGTHLDNPLNLMKKKTPSINVVACWERSCPLSSGNKLHLYKSTGTNRSENWNTSCIPLYTSLWLDHLGALWPMYHTPFWDLAFFSAAVKLLYQPSHSHRVVWRIK